MTSQTVVIRKVVSAKDGDIQPTISDSERNIWQEMKSQSLKELCILINVLAVSKDNEK